MDELSQLLCQLQQGSERALEIVMMRWRRPMETLAGRLLADPVAAEDVVQDALLILWRQRAAYDPRRPAWPWVAQIVRRLCHQRWRRRGGRRRGGVPVDVSLELAGYVHCPLPRPDDASEQREVIELARRWIEEMPPSWREVIRLTLLGDSSEADAAALLGVSRGTIKSRKHRALAWLRRRIQDATQ